ncbi:uncharacterized protein MJAP1_001810 [Malassezia japonica]|uniref:Uncharacterized protein n=1 Tax=Malassezia japonica TaxID=223818 RepID=A0AAF0F2X9_9BASI|nr:uncharacterized protein MJAP1_001810 [Malassezia japonica]WFD38846.1 hypothetical protein MJAP1_001810 [Malassezia japonica]
MRTAARRPVRGAAEGSKAKALPLDQVLQHIQRADGLDRAVVAALISHLHASDLARSISLYTSTNTKESEAGLAWAARDDNRYPIEAGIVRVAKQAANAVLTTLQSLLDAPQGALRDELALFILLDCFRVAMATLTKAQGSVEQLGAVGLSVARKLIALAKYSEALTELVAVAACVAGSDVGSGTVRTPPPPVVRMHTIFAVPMGGPGEAHVRSVLDIQALAVHAALAQAGERDIDAIHTIYRLEHGPGAWQAHARNIGLDSAADRAAYAMERAIFQHLSRCKASGPAAYMLRMDTLRHLAPVAQLDVDAYWDRVERRFATADHLVIYANGGPRMHDRRDTAAL